MIIKVSEDYDLEVTATSRERPAKLDTIIGIKKHIERLKKHKIWEDLTSTEFVKGYKIGDYKYLRHSFAQCSIISITSIQRRGGKLNHRMNLWQRKNTVTIEL